LIVAPGSLFTAIFISWIWEALGATISTLDEKKQTVKADIYKQLKMYVGIAAFFICVVTAADMVKQYASGNDGTTTWETNWMYNDAATHTVFAGVLVFIMSLWRPNERTADYAYSMTIPDEVSNEISVEMEQLDEEEGFQRGKE